MHCFDVAVGHLFSYPKIPGVLLFYDFLTDGFSLFLMRKANYRSVEKAVGRSRRRQNALYLLQACAFTTTLSKEMECCNFKNIAALHFTVRKYVSEQEKKNIRKYLKWKSNQGRKLRKLYFLDTKIVKKIAKKWFQK